MNSSIKQSITSGVQQAAYSAGLTPKLAKRTSVARVVMFHGVGYEQHTKVVFERQIKYLKKHFNVVSLEHMIEMNSAGEPFSNEVVLTFDDGLRNNFTHGYPILEKHQAPATFYVCPGLIENQTWLWNQEARERLNTIPVAKLQSLAEQWGCEATVEKIITWLKTLPVHHRQEAEDLIRQETPTFSPTSEQRNAFDMMSWSELQSIDKSLVTIGSHTTNHVIAKELSGDELKREIIDSKTILEQKLDSSVSHFCYPNGDFDDATVATVRDTYQSAVTTSEGFVGRGDDQFLFNRIPSANSMSYFAWRLCRPTS